MPETPEQLHARAAGALRTPPVQDWDTWPFVGEIRPKPLLGRVERAVLAAGGIARVHIGRWGEGAEHLHWWFIGRPEGFGQLRSSFAEIWDEVLPPTPRDVWQENLDRVIEALNQPSTPVASCGAPTGLDSGDPRWRR
jgi:hypothetical protein